MEKAKVGLIQFCISPPKTDVCIDLFICHFFFFAQQIHIVAAALLST